MRRLLRWSSWVFVGAAVLLMSWGRRAADKVDPMPPLVWALFVVAAVTLPAAALQVYLDNDAKSRRYWLLMLVILGLLLVAAIMMKPVRL